MEARHALLALVAAGLLGGCSSADLRAAHSLDRGEWSAGLMAQSQLTVASGELYPADALEPEPAGVGLSLPWELQDSSIEARVGLGKGWTLGLRGLPVRPLLGVTWSFLDERREAAPLSLALAMEAGYGPRTNLVLGLGLLGSRTAPLSEHFALVPSAGLWLGPSLRRLELDLPQRYATDPAGAPPALWWDLEGLGASVPIGVEAPVRLSERWALAPTLAWTPTAMLAAEIDAGCRNCSVGTLDLERRYTAELWLGLRLRPWMDPARRTP